MAPTPGRALATFFELLHRPAGPDAFNPWTARDAGTDLPADAPAQRLERLRRHLDCEPRWLLIGEAAGYQGCHVSGIPFTSERLILAGAIPRLPASARLSIRARPWSEPSATTVWKNLHALGIAEVTILWNAYPWHPHRRGVLQSNRTPTPAERAQGAPVLHALLAAFPGARALAVGRQSQAALAELGIGAPALRHPSMGGAMEFASGLRGAVNS